MGTTLLQTPNTAATLRNTFGFFDDLENFNSGNRFTDISPDSLAACSGLDAVSGQVSLLTGNNADNQECYLTTTKENFLIAANKPILFEAMVKYTEANTDDANVMIGLADAVGADTIVDNGAGPKTSFSGAAFFKVDGGTNWKTITSIGATQNIVSLTALNSLDKTLHTAGGGAWTRFRIEIQPVSSTEAEVSFFIDDSLVQRETITYTGATEMQAFVGVKAGGTNNETVYVDYIQCWQTR
jgi:hypothetical protein